MRNWVGPILFCVASSCATSACATPGASNAEPRGFESARETGLLDTYRELGLVVGPDSFPIIGRFVYLKGPADSTLVGFTASIPNALLRFSREGDLFAASYQVQMTFGAGADTIRRVNRREVVRVERFAETERTDESVIFERFVPLLPARYVATVTVRELSSRHEASAELELEVPRFGAEAVPMSAPLVAYRAAARSTYEQTPPLILAPRSTVAYTTAPAMLVVEGYTVVSGPLLTEALVEGEPVWRDTVDWQFREGGPTSGLAQLPLDLLPPGRADLRVGVSGTDITRQTPLLVAGADEWVFASFEQALPYFAYAIDEETMDAWRAAGPLSRALLWQQFWIATDTVPDTPSNEFLVEYFGRMSRASERYPEPGEPGWRTDRGRAYVQLGEPDREILHPPRITGQNTMIEWVYDEALSFPVQLFFEAENAYGTYNLTLRSAQMLADAVQRLREDRKRAATAGPAVTGAGAPTPVGSDDSGDSEENP